MHAIQSGDESRIYGTHPIVFYTYICVRACCGKNIIKTYRAHISSCPIDGPSNNLVPASIYSRRILLHLALDRANAHTIQVATDSLIHLLGASFLPILSVASHMLRASAGPSLPLTNFSRPGPRRNSFRPAKREENWHIYVPPQCMQPEGRKGADGEKLPTIDSLN